MKIILFLFAFSALSCSDDKEYLIQPNLSVIVNGFFIDAETHGVVIRRENLIVISAVIDGGKSGIAPTQNGQRKVIIQNYIAESDNELRKKIVLYHELGHSLLGRGHIDHCNSIMNTSACINCEIDEYYLSELFKFNSIK